MMMLATVLLTTLCTALEGGAEVALKQWAGPADGTTSWTDRWGRPSLLALGVVLYAVIGLVYGFALVYSTVTIANSIWQCLSILLITAIGVLFFKDKPTLIQWAGLVATLLGLIFLILGDGRSARWSPVSE